MLRDLVCVQVLMKSYAELAHSLEISDAESKVIFYYGACSIGKPFSLIRNELDDYFSEDVVSEIEEVNDYFRLNLMTLLQAN